MGFFNRIFGGRNWEDLPIKFVDSIKHQLNEHNFKVLQSLTLKHRILDLRIFQDTQILDSNPYLSIKVLSFSLIILGNKLLRNGSYVEAENAFLLSLMLYKNHYDNPSHFCLTILYSLTNREAEAKNEATNTLHMIDTLSKKVNIMQKYYPDMKNKFLNPENPSDFGSLNLMLTLITKMINDIIIYGYIWGGQNKTNLFDSTDLVLILNLFGDTELKPFIDKLQST